MSTATKKKTAVKKSKPKVKPKARKKAVKAKAKPRAKRKPNTKPTRTYTSMDKAFAYFNRALFVNKLPSCLITLQRKKGSLGYFSGGRFAALGNGKEVTDEIALNPNHFSTQTPTGILSTLVHEMVHLWQHHFGKPSRGTYHNHEFAGHMIAVGLIPSHTGLPDGKMVGQKMSHYIEPGGKFEAACKKFLAKNEAILYLDLNGEDKEKAKKKNASKTKYTCPECEVNAWAKPETNLLCGDCSVAMAAEQKGGEGGEGGDEEGGGEGEE